MNISQNNFYGREQNSVNQSQLAQQAVARRNQIRQGSALYDDVCEFSTKPVQKNSKAQKQNKTNKHNYSNPKVVDGDKYKRLVKENSVLRGIVAGIGALGCVVCLNSKPAEEMPDAVSIHANYGTSVTQLAEIYGSDADVIIEANDLDGEKMTKSMKLVIPSEYTPVNDEIKELQEKLFSSKLDDKERTEIENKIYDLKNMISMQSEIAQTYSDGEFIYFKLTLPTDETATDTQAVYNGAINVEEFKQIFNIADGAIKDNNNIGFKWIEDGTVMSYSDQDLYDGDIVKVPVESIIQQQ